MTEEHKEKLKKYGIIDEMKFSMDIENYHSCFKSYLKHAILRAYNAAIGSTRPLLVQEYIGPCEVTDYWKIGAHSKVYMRFLVFDSLESKRKFSKSPESNGHKLVQQNWEMTKTEYLANIKKNLEDGHQNRKSNS